MVKLATEIVKNKLQRIIQQSSHVSMFFRGKLITTRYLPKIRESVFGFKSLNLPTAGLPQST